VHSCGAFIFSSLPVHFSFYCSRITTSSIQQRQHKTTTLIIKQPKHIQENMECNYREEESADDWELVSDVSSVVSFDTTTSTTRPQP